MILRFDLLLIYYNVDLLIFLVFYVLLFGLGVIIFYELFDGIEKFIVLFLCIFVLVEKNYF